MTGRLIKPLKYCPQCQKERGVEEFHVDRSRSDGRCRTCKWCIRNGSNVAAATNWLSCNACRYRAKDWPELREHKRRKHGCIFRGDEARSPIGCSLQNIGRIAS